MGDEGRGVSLDGVTASPLWLLLQVSKIFRLSRTLESLLIRTPLPAIFAVPTPNIFPFLTRDREPKRLGVTSHQQIGHFQICLSPLSLSSPAPTFPPALLDRVSSRLRPPQTPLGGAWRFDTEGERERSAEQAHLLLSLPARSVLVIPRERRGASSATDPDQARASVTFVTPRERSTCGPPDKKQGRGN
jgi:hypothetical protein